MAQSDYEYEMRERAEFNRALGEPDKDPLSERKEACANFLDAMASKPELVGERIGWLIDGNYGYGSYKYARDVVIPNRRANRQAQLTHIIGALEWRCPVTMTMKAWHKLTPAQKKALDAAVTKEIESYESEHGIASKVKKHRFRAVK
jgi:hypothetical protein